MLCKALYRVTQMARIKQKLVWLEEDRATDMLVFNSYEYLNYSFNNIYKKKHLTILCCNSLFQAQVPSSKFFVLF